MTKYICIDIGGSAVKHALISEEGKIIKTGMVGTPKTLDEFTQTIQMIQNEYNEEETEGIAISMPGLIDSATGHAVHGGALSFILDMNIKDILKEKIHVPFEVENDGKCAALGEHWMGNLVGVENGIALVIGTGVGGGIIVHNKLLRGHHLSAGEFSFIRTNSESDDYQYVFALQGSSRVLGNNYAKIKGVDEREMNGKIFFADVNSGDKAAEALLYTYTEKLTKQLFNLQTILDPEVITIGGGISCQPVLYEYINKHIQEAVEKSPFPLVVPNVKQSSLGNKANLLGALVNFKEKQAKQ